MGVGTHEKVVFEDDEMLRADTTLRVTSRGSSNKEARLFRRDLSDVSLQGEGSRLFRWGWLAASKMDRGTHEKVVFENDQMLRARYPRNRDHTLIQNRPKRRGSSDAILQTRLFAGEMLKSNLDFEIR